jgi:hypothetical protein
MGATEMNLFDPGLRRFSLYPRVCHRRPRKNGGSSPLQAIAIFEAIPGRVTRGTDSRLQIRINANHL